MPRPSRRIVTGHDETGKSIVLSDGPPPHILNRGTNVDFFEMWNIVSPDLLAVLTADLEIRT